MGWKPSSKESFKWLKYSEVKTLAEQIGSAFVQFGLEPGQHSFVGIFARNRPEVVLVFQFILIKQILFITFVLISGLLLRQRVILIHLLMYLYMTHLDQMLLIIF